MSKTVAVSDQNGTEALAAQLASIAKAGDVILMHGTLGMGKSAFCRAFDLYRLSDAEEVHELDIEDAFADAVSLIEWPDRLDYLTPQNRLDIHIEPGPNEDARVFVLEPHGADWESRIANMTGKTQ